MGINKVDIKPRQSDTGKLWYRVIAGAYRSEEKFNSIKAILSKNNVTSLALKKERESF